MRALALLTVLVPLWAAAGSNVRYALVIGNNRAPGDVDLEPLQHAEQDAQAIADQLVKLGNFQRDRVEVVVGRDRRAVLAAAQRLALRRQQDQGELGSQPTLFAFFFTGHGQSGRLLTAGGALDGADIARVFTEMDASLSLAFIDACYAGSLDWDSLKAKGATVTPGFNPITELPKEVLDAEGTMWFVSSRSGEPSYEDRELGGLFTHFLLEGFTAAPQDSVGVSLENLWEYARQHTSTFAAEHGHRQNPERIVRRLKSRSPTYLSFPRARTAALVFDAAIEGNFVLQYEEAALIENISKVKGHPLEVKAYDGDVVLTRLASADNELASQRLPLVAGARVQIRDGDAPPGTRSIGFTDVSIRAKGRPFGLSFSERSGETIVAVGAGYRFAWPSANLLGAMHTGGVHVQVLREHFGLELSLATGSSAEKFPSWSYQATQLAGELTLAYGFDLGALRVDLELSGGPRVWLVSYGDGAHHTPQGGWVGTAVRAQLGLPFNHPWVLLQLRGGLGAGLEPATAFADARIYPVAMPVLEAGLAIPLRL